MDGGDRAGKRKPQTARGHKASYQKSTPGGVDELGAFTQIGAFGLTGEWVFGQRTPCGMMAAPYGSGFPAMAAD